jgi:hypothetical protein
MKYCTKEEYESKECILDNSIIKTQFPNNLIIFGDFSFRYLNFLQFSNGDMIFETSPYPVYPSKNVRIFYGLKNNGRYYFKKNDSNEETPFKNLTAVYQDEVKFESVLLTGNNTDNEESVFSKKKHNYDLREKVSNEMKEIFHKYNKNFQNGLEYIFNKKDLLFLNNEIFYKNNLNLFASACYMISYNLKDIIDKGKQELLEFKENFKEIIIKSLRKEEDFNNFNMSNVYEKNNFGFDECYELFENDFDEYYDNYFNLENEINLIIENQFKSIEIFIDRIKRYFKLPERADEENQNRILSFPWVIAGKMLSSLKVVK